MKAPDDGGTGQVRPPSPFRDSLGIVVSWMRDGRASVELPEAEVLQNAHGTVHGGAIATLADVAVAMAANSIGAPGASVITVAMTTSYLNAGRGALVAEARVLSAGKSIVNVEADIADAAGQPVAKAVATLKYIRPRGAETNRT